MGDELFMLDTNIFNRVVEGRLSVAPSFERKLIATQVQHEELASTPNPEKRESLLKIFSKTVTVVPGASFCFDVPGAGFGQATWNDGTGRFDQMLALLKEFDRGKKKNKKLVNQLSDIVIAETALSVDATLISDDCNLCQVITRFGGRVISSTEFQALQVF